MIGIGDNVTVADAGLDPRTKQPRSSLSGCTGVVTEVRRFGLYTILVRLTDGPLAEQSRWFLAAELVGSADHGNE